jgi:hypothetical protein
MGKQTLDPRYYHLCKGKLACVLYSGQTLINGIGPPFPRSWYTEQIAEKNAETPVFVVQLPERDVERLDLVKTFLERVNFRVCKDRPRYDSYVGTWLGHFGIGRSFQEITLRAPNFDRSIIRIYGKGLDPWYGAGLAIIPVAYGSIHLTAWNITFPTTAEKLFWYASCFYLLGSAVALAMVIYWGQFEVSVVYSAARILEGIKSSENKDTRFGLGLIPKTPIKMGEHLVPRVAVEKLLKGRIPKTPVNFCAYLIARQFLKEGLEKNELEGVRFGSLREVIFGGIQARLRLVLGTNFPLCRRVLETFKQGLQACFGILYLAARIYLVAESFLSLRNVPIGVYQTPYLNVMGLIPHI